MQSNNSKAIDRYSISIGFGMSLQKCETLNFGFLDYLSCYAYLISKKYDDINCGYNKISPVIKIKLSMLYILIKVRPHI